MVVSDLIAFETDAFRGISFYAWDDDSSVPLLEQVEVRKVPSAKV